MTITGWIGITKVVPPSMGEAYVNQSVALMVLPKYIDSHFVSYQLNSPSLRSTTNELSIGVGRSSLSLDSIRSIPLSVAPLSEQRRIVALIEEQFSRLDAGVAALERVRANLKRYRTAVLKAAVEGRLTETWRQENPDAESASELLGRILRERRERWEQEQLAAYEKKGKKPPKNWRSKYKEPARPDTEDLSSLPDGWMWVSVDAFLTSLRSGSPAVPNDDGIGVPILRSSSVRPGAVDFQDARYVSGELLEDNFLHEHDLLFTRLSGSLEYVGNCAVVKGLGDRRIQYPDRLFRARLVDHKYAPYLSYCFASPLVREAIKAVAKSSAGHQRISQSAIKDLVIPLPPTAEQAELVAEVERRMSIIQEVDTEIEADLKRAARLRQAILKHAFEGRLVPQDPSDEPASKLLERIRKARERGIPPKHRRRTKLTCDPTEMTPQGNLFSNGEGQG